MAEGLALASSVIALMQLLKTAPNAVDSASTFKRAPKEILDANTELKELETAWRKYKSNALAHRHCSTVQAAMTISMGRSLKLRLSMRIWRNCGQD